MPDLPLANIRVLDLSRVFAMPYAGAYMADLGAEVIKVDSCQAQFMDTTRTLNGPYPGNDPGENHWNRAGTFQTLNRGKRSVTLDLRSDSALDILKQLVSISDIVLENFTPRVMRRFGLDYANLKAVNPGLIMVSNTGYGHGGPWTNFGAMATALEPTHGTGAFMGYLDHGSVGAATHGESAGSVPNKIGNSYSDFLASWTAQMAVLACLIHRARTGQGMWIDLAMYQVGVSFLGEGILDYAFNGRAARRLGNRHPAMSPHGCYPCLGNDQWVTLAVRDDAEWQAFCVALDQPEMAADPRFSQPLERWNKQDALDANISSWTGKRTSYQVMEILQSAGVPAGPVLNARQLLTDAHWRDRGYFEAVDHPPETGLGRREYVSRGWRLSGTGVKIRSGAPQLGDSNEYVLQGLLGLSGGEIQTLEDGGVIGSQPIGGSPAGAVPLQRQAELGWIVDFNPDAALGQQPSA